MPRTGVSYDDVVESIHVLEKAGLTTSIRNIRERIGKGSLSTIAEHKREYDLASAESDREALPDAIAKGLIQGAETYWKELTEAAEAEIAAIQAAADETAVTMKERISTLEDELAGAQEALNRETLAKEAVQATLADAESACEAFESDLAASQTEKEALAARLDEARAVGEKAETASARQADMLTEAHREIAALSERVDHGAAKHASELAQSQSSLADALAQVASLTEARDTAAERAFQAAETAKEQTRRGDRLESAHEDVLRKLADVRRALEDDRSQFNDEKQRLAAALAVESALVEEKDNRISDLKGTLAQTEKALAEALLRVVVTDSEPKVDKS